MTSQRRMAAEILKCGEYRVWMAQNPKIAQAITRADVRRLIADKLIKKLPVKKVKRIETKRKLAQKRKGRRKGTGSRKGTIAARIGKKTFWLKIVRPQRALLKELKDKKSIEPKSYRKIYRLIKGNAFRSKAHLMLYLQERGLVKKEEKK